MSFEDVKKKVEEEVEKVEEVVEETLDEVSGGGINNKVNKKKFTNPAEVIDKSNNKHSDVL